MGGLGAVMGPYCCKFERERIRRESERGYKSLGVLPIGLHGF